MGEPPKDLRSVNGLRRIIAMLRGPDGCAWDRAQTRQSLRPYLLEEASEALDALDEDDSALLCEELGDLLFHVLLHVRIAEERGDFLLSDVVGGIAEKLVRRHPHVFGQATAETPDEVVEQWDELKRAERGEKSALTGIPVALPALSYAQVIQSRASKAGFAFESIEQAWEAFEEEVRELREARDPAKAREEIGDALFALTNLARWYEADAEEALRSTCRGFTRLFHRLEELARERGTDLNELELDEKLALWQDAKEIA
ncbi:MAG: nucleoside triphosphate pyrophosphohydrolase [Chloroflexi bacterium]|nr:MAG: nucleoside triphosphate pyrophosphohydrolase [Chloroflexota bacterium]